MKRMWLVLSLLSLIVLLPACNSDQVTESEIPDSALYPSNGEVKEEDALPEPTSPPPEDNSGEMPGGSSDFEKSALLLEEVNLIYTFVERLGGSPVSKTYIGSEGDEDGWMAYPSYRRIEFEDYILKDSFLSPVLIIYPLAEYRQLSNYADSVIGSLEDILDRRQIPEEERELPFLPDMNAAQQFYSNQRFIDFKNGSGLRYLTQLVQDYSPVVNDGLIYTFQGITADRRYYITVIMPVNHPELAANWDQYFDSGEVDHEDFSENYHEYLADTAWMLEMTGDKEFLPDLTFLDQFITSLQVE